MILYVGIIALQVYCIVDVIRRNGRTFWIFPLLIAPVVSAIAYFIVEILPTLQHNCPRLPDRPTATAWRF